MIPAGSLNRRLTLFRQETSRSATGTETSSPVAFATVWAAQASLNLSDATRMAGASDAIEAKFVLRYRSDLTTTMEVVCDNRRYAIVQIDPSNTRDRVTLLVRAI